MAKAKTTPKAKTNTKTATKPLYHVVRIEAPAGVLTAEQEEVVRKEIDAVAQRSFGDGVEVIIEESRELEGDTLVISHTLTPASLDSDRHAAPAAGTCVAGDYLIVRNAACANASRDVIHPGASLEGLVVLGAFTTREEAEDALASA